MKHTPGPWAISTHFVADPHILAPDGFPVAVVEDTAIMPGYSEKLGVDHWSGNKGSAYIERPVDEFEANARLIAAAPELCDAVRLVLMFHAGGPWTPSKRDAWTRIAGTADATTKVMCDHLRRVLAKVEETP